MDPVFVTEVAVVGLAGLAVLALVVRSVLRRRRGRDEEWAEDVEPGEVKMRPGAGWGNGGSWH